MNIFAPFFLSCDDHKAARLVVELQGTRVALSVEKSVDDSQLVVNYLLGVR